MENLGEAMERRGLGPHDLEDLTGVAASNTYAMKSGSRIMGEKAAAKLGRALGVDPDLLRVGNLSKAMKRSLRRGDHHGVITAARHIVEISERDTLTGEGEHLMIELVEGAVAFAEYPHLFEFQGRHD